ncbi:epoxide hydrolase [Polymorphobacter glacialis]|uniref:Epoxide hydrolase n=1 Tax=Sandarakinorhabdus glacialis TaxID=1614636 RepID=A0A916ZVS4_9SPHN|nr:alpha/beta hydrolase [Polymorphobacter glacialis]GGE15135.1 epoxide hydrolase [Polymorphobacter glacialis]
MLITTRTISANGLDFAIDECGSGDSVALFLHGFPESRYSWRHQLPLLAELGWHAVAPDLRGYGDSSRPLRKADYHIDNLVADTAAIFDALGAKRRLLIAHDWGAIIAWIFALRETRPLDGLIVMNVPHPKVFTDVLHTSSAQKRKSWYVAFFQLPWLPEKMLGANRAAGIGRAFTDMAVDKSAFPPEVVDHYRDNASKPGALTAMINYYRANAATITKEPAPFLETPTLMVWGEEDTALDIALTEGYGPLVRDFTLVRLPGVSHWVQQEAPVAVNAAIADWLGRGAG